MHNKEQQEYSFEDCPVFIDDTNGLIDEGNLPSISEALDGKISKELDDLLEKLEKEKDNEHYQQCCS